MTAHTSPATPYRPAPQDGPAGRPRRRVRPTAGSSGWQAALHGRQPDTQAGGGGQRG
jgi:hypothetical protein